MEFPKYDQITIIVTRGSEDALLTRALTIIHNDIITHSKSAAKVYCSKGLIEGLICKYIYFLISHTNHLYLCHQNSRNSSQPYVSTSLQRLI